MIKKIPDNSKVRYVTNANPRKDFYRSVLKWSILAFFIIGIFYLAMDIFFNKKGALNVSIFLFFSVVVQYYCLTKLKKKPLSLSANNGCGPSGALINISNPRKDLENILEASGYNLDSFQENKKGSYLLDGKKNGGKYMKAVLFTKRYSDNDRKVIMFSSNYL